MKIKGSVVIVTGGARGLGLEISKHLLSLGASVYVIDKDENALLDISGTFPVLVADLLDVKQAKAVVENIYSVTGRVDILVNNAGFIYSEPLVNLMKSDEIVHSFDRFRSVVALNLDTVFIMTSVVIEQMVRFRSKGVVINISSISARGNEGQTAYSAAKSGVEAMTRTWSKELARIGIRSNAVAPGFIDTDSTASSLSSSILDRIKASTPLRRLGNPIEVAQAVQALIENEFLNGVVLDVNGGIAI